MSLDKNSVAIQISAEDNCVGFSNISLFPLCRVQNSYCQIRTIYVQERRNMQDFPALDLFMYGIGKTKRQTSHQVSNFGNFVNRIFQERQLEHMLHFVCSCITLSSRTLIFLVKIKSHLGQ